MSEVSLTVLIPMHNEEGTIAEVVRRLFTVSFPCPMNVIVIDDASTDGSIKALESVPRPDFERLTLLQRETNGGKGAALAAGLAYVSSSHVAVLDADLELAPEDLIPLVTPIASGSADAAIGCRAALQGARLQARLQRLPYALANSAISRAFNIKHGSGIRDVMSGYKVLPYYIWREADLRQQGFAVEVELAQLLVRSDVRMAQVPVSYLPRSRRDGKKIKARDAAVALRAIFAADRAQSTLGQIIE